MARSFAEDVGRRQVLLGIPIPRLTPRPARAVVARCTRSEELGGAGSDGVIESLRDVRVGPG